VESSCEFGIEPSGSMKCWETTSGLTSSGLSSSAQPHRERVCLGCFFPSQVEIKDCVLL
jgi:hypothetical protein